MEIINQTWHLNWEKLSWKYLDLKIKKNSGETTVKKAYNKQRNLVVKLNKEAKKSFWKKQIIENATNEMENFWKLCKPFFIEKYFHYKHKFALKTKRGQYFQKLNY